LTYLAKASQLKNNYGDKKLEFIVIDQRNELGP